jgi:hypothetical protein
MTTPTQAEPYSLQASTELSQDYFLTSDIVMQATDEVIPFINPYLKQVEAIVFSPTGNGGNGAVYHLQRDPTASTGWMPVTIDYSAQLGSAVDVAVAGNGSAAYLLTYGSDTGNGMVWLTNLTGAATWDPTGLNATWDDLGLGDLEIDIPPSTPLGPFKGGIDPHGYPYFYAAATDLSSQTTTLIAWVAGVNTDRSGLEINYQLLQSLGTSGNKAVIDYSVLFDSAGGSSPVGYSLVLTADGILAVYAEQPFTEQNVAQFTDPLTTAGSSGVTALLAAWTTPDSQSGVPGYVFQAQDTTWFAPEDGSNAASLADHPIQAPNSVTVWTGDLNVVNLLDANDTLNTILETAPGTWQAPIPTVPGPVVPPGTPGVPGLKSIFGVPTDLTQSTLFAVGLDNTLSVLILDEAGWTQTLVRQEGTQQAEISSYRIQVTVLDANGVPVPDASVEVGTDRPVGFWQPSGGSYLTPAAPVTLVTNASGNLVFSVPAEELDCAVLAVQALGPNGSPTGSPLTVTPDTDVRGFLNGTGILTDLGTMNGGNALLAAKNSSRGNLFPGLTGLSGDAQAQAIKQSAQALSTFIAAGTKTKPADGTQSIQLSMSNGVPSVQASAEAFAFGAVPGGDLTLSLGSLFDTIGHALRHGAAKLASITAHFVDEATGWLISIGAEIAGAIQNFTNLVISDMKDAFHAIGGFFQALGADIVEGLQWLMHNVVELLQAAWANGKAIASAIGAAPAGLAHQIQKLDITVDNFFTNLEGKVTTGISQFSQHVNGKTLGSAPNQTPPAPGDTGSSSAQSGLAKDFGLFTRVINDTPGMWLYNKFEEDVPPIVSLGMPNVTQSKYDTIVNDDLATDWAGGIALVEALQTYLTDIISSVFGDTSTSARDGSLPNLYNSFTTYKFLNDTDTVVVKFLEFCDDVAKTIIDIVVMVLEDLSTVITTSFQIVSPSSLLGLLLDDVLHIDPTLTVAEIIGMVIGFPATLVGKILGKGDTLPPLPTLPTGDSTGAPPLTDMDPTVKLWLGILGGTTQAIWGFADLIGDLQTFKDDGPKRPTQSGVIDMFDMWCPLFETFFLYPYDAPEGSIDWALPWITLSAVTPSVFGLLGLFSWDKATQTLKAAGADDSILNGMNDYVSPFVQAFSGAVNTGVGITYQVETGDTYWVDIAGTALGNLSFMFAPLATWWLNSNLEDVPVIIKMIIDAIGNIGAAVCIYESTSLPPTR